MTPLPTHKIPIDQASSPLMVVAVASNDATRLPLLTQLQGFGFISFTGVLTELSDAARLCSSTPPDVIIVELTERELDGGLFIEAISMNPSKPCVVIALHRKLDHAIVLEAVRRGAKEFIHYPNDPGSLEVALKRIHQQLAHKAVQLAKASQPRGQLITVFAAKGGAGCSTLAVNLAHQAMLVLKQAPSCGYSLPVCLLDMDQVFSNTSVMLNLNPAHCLADLTQTPIPEVDDALFNKITLHHDSGLDLMVGSKNVMDDNPMVSEALLARTLAYLTSHYALVVVDLPTHVLDAYHQYLAQQSDTVLLVSGADVPSLYRTRQYLKLAQAEVNPDKIKLLLNRYTLNGAFGMGNRQLEEEFKHPVLARLPNDWALNVEANSLGCVLGKVNPKADLVKAIQALACLLLGLQPSKSSAKQTKVASPVPTIFDKWLSFGKPHLGLDKAIPSKQ
jgi:pilus assembly protein CpaE